MVALEKSVFVLVTRLEIAVLGLRVRAVGGVAPVLEFLFVVLQCHEGWEQAVASAASEMSFLLLVIPELTACWEGPVAHVARQSFIVVCIVTEVVMRMSAYVVVISVMRTWRANSAGVAFV